MSTDQFRALETLSGSGDSHFHKADDLIIAAIIAFTSLTRPGRHDMLQLEDLTIPLLSHASLQGKREAAEILAPYTHVPIKLIMTLCHDQVEIAAPLLLRSPALSTNNLIELIDRHGLLHARIIARRANKDPLLVPLLQSFNDSAIDRFIQDEDLLTEDDYHFISETPAAMNLQPTMVLAANTPTASESVISHLTVKPTVVDALINKALLIDQSLFRYALADTLGISPDRAEKIIGQWPDSQLPLALKAIGLSAQDCYLILTAVLGTIQGDRDSLRDFVHIYRSINQQTAQMAVQHWKSSEANKSGYINQLGVGSEDYSDILTRPANTDNELQKKHAF